MTPNVWRMKPWIGVLAVLAVAGPWYLAVALMTDTDNGNGHAVSYYGDIFFTSE